MPIYLGGTKLKELFVGGTRVKKAYVGGTLIYQYDSTGPSLTVTAPTGTSTSSPTYYQSDSTASYTVKGTVTDTESGVASVTVNGAAATISGSSWSKAISLATNTTHTIKIVATDKAGNTTTVNRYLKIESIDSIKLTGGKGSATAGTTGNVYVNPVKNYTISSQAGSSIYNGNGGIVVGKTCTLAVKVSVTIKLSTDRYPVVAIMKNGYAIAVCEHPSRTTNAVTLPCAYIGKFAAGDVITVRAGCNYLDSGATVTVNSTTLSIDMLRDRDAIAFKITGGHGSTKNTATGGCHVAPVYMGSSLVSASGSINYIDGKITVYKSCTLTVTVSATVQISESRYPIVWIQKNGVTKIADKENTSATTNAVTLSVTYKGTFTSGNTIQLNAGTNYADIGTTVTVTNASIVITEN